MSSKLFTLFLLVAIIKNASAISEEMQELMDSLHKQCVGQTDVAEDLIENARKGDFSEDDKLKCYIKCIYTEAGVMDEDTGDIDGGAVVAVMPEEYQDRAAATVKKCGVIKGSNHCDTAWLTTKCYQKEIPDIFLMP